MAGWSQVGNSLSISTFSSNDDSSITGLSDDTIALYHEANDELQAYDFNGTNWATKGAPRAFSSNGYTDICALTDTLVAGGYFAFNRIYANTFNGTTWTLGNFLSVPSYGGAVMESIGGFNIAFMDGTNQQLRAYNFNGSTFVLVGSGLNIGVAIQSMAKLGDDLIALVLSMSGTSTLRAYSFNGSTWSQEGNDYAITGVTFARGVGFSPNRIAIISYQTQELQAFDFDGSDFAPVGDAYDLSALMNSSNLAFDAARMTDTRIAVFTSTGDGNVDPDDDQFITAFDFEPPPPPAGFWERLSDFVDQGAS